MGDVAMTAPVLRAISQKYGSEVRLVMLTPKFHTPFFFGIDNLEIFNIDLHNEHKGVSGIKKLYGELTQSYNFDCVIDLNHKLFSRLLRRFFILADTPTFKITKGREEKKELTQQKNKRLIQLKTSIERYADVFREAGFDIELDNRLTQVEVRELPLFASKALSDIQVQNLSGQSSTLLVGISPFAKHQGKTLPLKTIRAVIGQLAESHPDVKIFIFGGGRLEKMVADSLVAWFPNTLSAIGRCTLGEEMDLMSNLNVMLSMDSSAMHLCSLLGVPTVSVWGATHPYAGFLGMGQKLSDSVSVDMECRPCSVYGHKACFRGDYACLNSIKASDIVAKIANYL